MIDLSIIIVSWNTRQILEDCLNSIVQETSGIEYETFVVDNASGDGSAEMVRSQFPTVQLIENTDNRGFAAANNQAIEKAGGRYILLLNSDTIVLDNALFKTVQYADGHPHVGVVGCRVLNADRSMQSSCFQFISVLNLLLSMSYLYKLFPKSRFFGRERMTWWDRSDEQQVDVVTGCFLMIRKEIVDKIGGLDESYFMYGEEMDWCWRVKQLGWQNCFTPSAEIVHLGGASSKLMRPEMYLQLRGSHLLFMKKHRSFPVYALACLLTALFMAFRIPYWAVKGLISKTDRRAYRQRAWTMIKGSVFALMGGKKLLYKP